jgi:glutaredoxin
MAKEFLEKSGVQYTEYDVMQDMARRKEMVQKSHQLGVPVIDIDGEIWVGFNRAEIGKTLGIR